MSGQPSVDEKRRMLAALLRKRVATAEHADEQLSESQQALWYWQRLHPQSSAYNLVASVTARGEVDLDILQSAVAALLARHPQLRARFPLQEGKPRRRLAKLEEFTTAQVDASAWSDDEFRRRWNELSDRPFDLEQGRLLQATILTRGPHEQVIHLCVHHIVTDFWSAMQMLFELGLDYRAARLGAPSPVATPKAAYGDFVAQESELFAGPEGARLAEYWRARLADAPTTLTMPVDLTTSGLSQEGSGYDRTVDAPSASKLRRLAEREGTTPYVVCMAAFCALLHRWTGQDDVLVGTPYHGRSQTEWQNLVGYFSNTMVIRSRRNEGTTFRTLLADLRVAVGEAIAHGRYPFSRLAEELADRRTTDRPPLVQAALAWEKVQRLAGTRHKRSAGKASITQVEGIDLELEANLEQRGAPFELMLQIHDDGESLDIHWQYARALFRSASIERLAEQYVELLASAVDDPDLDPADRPTASAADRTLLDAWNTTHAAYPQDVCLHDLIAAQAGRAPQNRAVRFRDLSLTYAELENRAGRLACRLQASGVGADVVVGVFMQRSAELVVALYGILKSGGAYMPLNPEDPWERTAFSLQDAGATVVVTERIFAATVAQAGLRVIIVDDAANADDPPLQNAPPPEAPTITTPSPRSLAYVIYTSGSTGLPKGVMNEHRSIVNRLLWMQDEYCLTATDRVLQKTPYTFDVSVWEFFWPLSVGAEIIVAEPGGHRDPAYLVRTITDYDVTTLHFVPTMLRAFLQQPGVERLRNVKRVFASGEALAPDLVDLFFRRCTAELHNLYGPTEAAVDVTYFPCVRGDSRASIPIGRPIANTEILILNRALELQPIGIIGELYIGGIGLARGYRNRRDLTDERFVPHPSRQGERLFRTGDLARWTAEGVIEYHGRCDNQVKLGGNRIELGEIEAALAALPAIADAAVVVHEDASGGKRLVGYVVPRSGATVDVDQVRSVLAAKLPAYMVPSALVTLPSLPQTTSGKIDRSALPELLVERESTRTTLYVAPRTTDERALAAIFAEVLRLDRVGVDDNFFDLGGASSQAVEIIGRAASLGYALSPDVLFRMPTIAGVAEACRLPQPITGNVFVESLGVYLPTQSLTSDEVIRGCVKKLTLPLGRLTGIKSRRVVGENEFSYDLAVRAVEQCHARSRGGHDDVDVVICCNISRYDGPNFTFSYEPSTAAKLCAQFGFDDALAFDVSNACAGMFTGVSIGESLIKSGLVRRVLVVSGEYISYLAETAKRTIESDFDSRLPCLTLGDAGAAVLLEGSSRTDVGFFELDLCSLAQHAELCVATMTPDGPIMITDMLGVSQVITQLGLSHWVRTAQRKNWSLSDVKHMIPHQVSQATITSGFNEMRKLSGIDVPMETVISNVAERGNTATTSHWVAVWDHALSGRIQAGDNLMFGISGSGITVGTGLYRFDDLPDRLRAGAPAPTTPTETEQRNSVPRRLRRRRLDPRQTKVVIAGVGTSLPTVAEPKIIDLSLVASRAALAESGAATTDVGLLIYTGIYRDEFLSEPAFAAMLANKLRLHDPAAAEHPPFFSFDLLNGSLGFLQACHLTAQRIQAGRIAAGLVATAEVEPQAAHPLGLAQSGAAFLLRSAVPVDGIAAGFGDFVFRNDWSRASARTAVTTPTVGVRFDPHVDLRTSPDLHANYVELLADAIEELRDLERLTWGDIGCALPPHIGPDFLQRLVARVPQVREKLIVDDTITGDLLTSSLPFAWQVARRRKVAVPGSVGLLLAVSAGLQAGCATYRFV